MDDEDFWLPLVDEPIGELVMRLQDSDPVLAALAGSPRRQLAFRTFAYVRVGVLLGAFLVDRDVDTTSDASWVELLLADPTVYEAVRKEVEAVGREVAADPEFSDDEQVGPDEGARQRFRDFARKLGG